MIAIPTRLTPGELGVLRRIAFGGDLRHTLRLTDSFTPAAIEYAWQSGEAEARLRRLGLISGRAITKRGSAVVAGTPPGDLVTIEFLNRHRPRVRLIFSLEIVDGSEGMRAMLPLRAGDMCHVEDYDASKGATLVTRERGVRRLAAVRVPARVFHVIAAAEVVDAEAAEVWADEFELRGDAPGARAFARQAANIYDRIGYSYFLQHMSTTDTATLTDACERGALAYAAAERCYRRGMSYMRANRTHRLLLRERAQQALIEGRTFRNVAIEEIEPTVPIAPVRSSVVGVVGRTRASE